MSDDGKDNKTSVEAEDDEFEVESLIEKKTVNKKNFYLVRWKNFGPQDDTWEPEDNLKDTAPEILEEFKTKERAKKAGSNTPRPPKKRPAPKYDSESDGGHESSKLKGSSESDEEFEVKQSTKKKSTTSSKKLRASSANGQTSSTKVSVAPAPVRRPVPKSLNWLESDDSDTDDDEGKKKKETEKKKKEEEDLKKKQEMDILREEQEKEAAERMVAAKIKEDEKDKERKAEKEKRRAEKEKRKEEKRKEREAMKDSKSDDLDDSKRRFDHGSIIVRITPANPEASTAHSPPPMAASVLPDSTNTIPTGSQLTSITKLKQSRDGIVSAMVLQGNRCVEMTIQDAWNSNPHGLLQYLLSRHQFEEEE